MDLPGSRVLEESDAIASPEGVDMLFFGPDDYSQGVGAAADWQNFSITAARRLVAEACP